MRTNNLIEQLRNKLFAEVLEQLNAFPDETEKYILKILALAGLEKTYSANYLVKDKLLIPDSAKLFAEMVQRTGFEIYPLYDQAAEDELGFLMWLAIEAQSYLPEQEQKVNTRITKTALLQKSKGLTDSNRLALYLQLKQQDDSLTANLDYAMRAVAGSREKLFEPVFQIIQQTLQRAISINSEGEPEPFELIMKATDIVLNVIPLDSQMALRFLEVAIQLQPDKKTSIAAAYIDLYNRSMGKEKFLFLSKAASVTTGITELVTLNASTLTGQLNRLADFTVILDKQLIYNREVINEVAENIFLQLDAQSKIDFFFAIAFRPDLNDLTLWHFIENLLRVLIKDDINQTSSLVPLLAKYWVLGSQQINFLLSGFARQYNIRYLESLLAQYAKQESEEASHLDQDKQYSTIILRKSQMHFQSEPAPELVIVGASLPKIARKGTEFTARLIAYTEGTKLRAERMVAGLSPGATAYMDLKKFNWQKGTKVTVRLQGTWLNVDETEQVFIWDDDVVLVDFDVLVSPNAPDTTTIVKFDILIDGIRVGKIRVDIEINNTVKEAPHQFVTQAPVQKAFASYASPDRERVLDRVAEIRRNGVDVFLDIVSIVPGSNWQQVLEQEIDNRAAFLLFWSVNAKESEMVDWEWRKALQLKGIEGIDPHPLDSVADAPPPEELKALHFNDVYMLMRQGVR